jgi:hypothetical protein
MASYHDEDGRVRDAGADPSDESHVKEGRAIAGRSTPHTKTSARDTRAGVGFVLRQPIRRLTLFTSVLGLLVPAAASAAPRTRLVVTARGLPARVQPSVRTGTLTVTVMGLPSGMPPRAMLAGPGVHKRVHARRVTLARTKPGRYTIVLAPVRVRSGWGTVKTGAVVQPFRRKTSVRLLGGRQARIAAAYGSIINPGLRVVRSQVLTVGGRRNRPTSLRIAGRHDFNVGDVLALPPTRRLPHGVLARVRSIPVSRSGGTTTVALTPVSVFEVMPVARFDEPLTGRGAAAHAAEVGPSCGPTLGPGSGVYRTISNPRFSGSWDTSRGLIDMPKGVQIALDFDLSLGIRLQAGAHVGFSCGVDIPIADAKLFGIPVFAAVFGDLHAAAEGGTGGGNADVTTHVHAGASTRGKQFWPDVSFGRPVVTSSWSADASVSAGFGVGVKAGLGVSGVAAVTLNFNNDVDFEERFDGSGGVECTVQAKFASFDGEADLGWMSFHTPSTPPLYTQTLWGPESCFGKSGVGRGTGGGSSGGGSGGSSGGGTARRPASPDVDGNGAMDLVLSTDEGASGTGVFALLSTYHRFLDPASWLDGHVFGWGGVKPLAGDVNGDGRADYVFLTNEGANGTKVFVSLSTGHGFSPPQLWWNGIGWGWDGIKPATGYEVG